MNIADFKRWRSAATDENCAIYRYLYRTATAEKVAETLNAYCVKIDDTGRAILPYMNRAYRLQYVVAISIDGEGNRTAPDEVIARSDALDISPSLFGAQMLRDSGDSPALILSDELDVIRMAVQDVMLADTPAIVLGLPRSDDRIATAIIEADPARREMNYICYNEKPDSIRMERYDVVFQIASAIRLSATHFASERGLPPTLNEGVTRIVLYRVGKFGGDSIATLADRSLRGDTEPLAGLLCGGQNTIPFYP